jgi:LmbE family N-acetylglucosaminyl deacetylase
MDLKIAVLCPHPDDFEIGFATGIRRLVLASCDVKIIYLTDGRYGTTNDFHDIVAIRKAEATNARKIAGIETYSCLDIEDGKLLALYRKQKHQLLDKLSEHVLGYDVIITPASSDLHPDHMASAKIAKDLIAASDAKAIIYYMVWLYPDFFPRKADVVDHIIALDVSEDDMAFKLKLIRCHESQVKRRQYDITAISRDEYFANLFDFKNYCEIAGISCKNVSLYEKLINSMSPGREISHYIPEGSSEAGND